MDLLKYFFEEPVSLEILTPDTEADAHQRREPRMSLESLLQQPTYARGYLAGRNADTEEVGLTSLQHPEAFCQPLLSCFGADGWTAMHNDLEATALDAPAVAQVVQNPAGVTALVRHSEPLDLDSLREVATNDRRAALGPLRALLDTGAVVFFPEPAHHGYDWSFFAHRPVKDDLVAAFRAARHDDIRRFVLPFQKARSEHKFYFDAWQLDAAPLPDYILEL